MASLALSANGEAFIKGFEKCRLCAYRDPGGVWTIGWGHTGPEVVEGLTWTQAQADAQFNADIARLIPLMARSIGMEATDTLNQNQIDALISFAFNAGIGSFRSSTLLRRVNQLRFSDVPAQLGRWIFVQGKVSNGLVARRAAEAALFQRSA